MMWKNSSHCRMYSISNSSQGKLRLFSLGQSRNWNWWIFPLSVLLVQSLLLVTVLSGTLVLCSTLPSQWQLKPTTRLRRQTSKQLVQSLVISRLDYCNNLLCGVTLELLYHLQVVLNIFAQLIARTMCHEHISPVLPNLHCQPVDACIDFKTKIMVCKALNGEAPGYLRCLLELYIPERALRSVDKEFPVVPRTKLRTVRDPGFCVHAPKMLNTLPHHVKSWTSLSSFRTSLKTSLFKGPYPSLWSVSHSYWLTSF